MSPVAGICNDSTVAARDRDEVGYSMAKAAESVRKRKLR
jgi:hypothetical protein